MLCVAMSNTTFLIYREILLIWSHALILSNSILPIVRKSFEKQRTA